MAFKIFFFCLFVIFVGYTKVKINIFSIYLIEKKNSLNILFIVGETDA